MSDEHIDPETLAALLDGTLSAAERERALETLARSDESYESMLESTAILNELSVQLRGTHLRTEVAVAPLSHVPSWRLPLRFALPFAAAAGIVLAVFALREQDPGVAWTSIDLAATANDAVSAPVPAGTGLFPGWGTVRGVDAAVPTQLLAFRTGVRFTDLEVAFRIRDTAAVAAIADTLAKVMRSIETGGQFSAEIKHLAREGGARATVAERRDLASRIQRLAGFRQWFELGSFVEAARLAAQMRRAEAFAPNALAERTMQELNTTVTVLPSSEREQLATVLSQLSKLFRLGSGGSADMGRLSASLDSVVLDLGR